jgi:trans-aconitate 2-methyltransferase
VWDPGQYQRYSGERSRPFADLLARVHPGDPGLVADLGCGPGNLTVELARRWPRAQVRGIDSSAEMIAAAEPLVTAEGLEPAEGLGPAEGRLSFALADVREWQPERAPDVIVSNAVLQWIPEHLDTLARWAGLLAPGGWVAVQVPGNFDQPAHVIMRELAASARWRPLLGQVELTRQSIEPAQYLDLLAGAGCAVDAWETTYLHVLTGPDPVLEWFRGTGLRPVLNALEPDQAEEFTAAYRERLRAAYPPEPYGTVLPFRRVFAVAHRPD